MIIILLNFYYNTSFSYVRVEFIYRYPAEITPFSWIKTVRYSSRGQIQIHLRTRDREVSG